MRLYEFCFKTRSVDSCFTVRDVTELHVVYFDCVTSQGSFTYVNIFSLLNAVTIFLTVEHINSNQSTLQYPGM